MPAWKIGDDVMLKSGGPRMKVEDAGLGDTVTCSWVDGGEIRREPFIGATLTWFPLAQWKAELSPEDLAHHESALVKIRETYARDPKDEHTFEEIGLTPDEQRVTKSRPRRRLEGAIAKTTEVA